MKNFSLFQLNGVERFLCRNFSAVASAFFLLLFVGVGAISAQDYKEATVDASLEGQKGTILASGDATNVQNFLKKFYLARWTVKANDREINKFRAELEADGVSLTGAAQTTFLSSVVDVLTSYAASKSVYPTCRYNAVLAIGMLNETASSDRNTPPVPYSGSLETLASFCTSSKDFPDYVRLGALIGLTRHAELGVKDDKMRAGVRSVFEKILDETYATDKKLQPEIYAWFQLKALEGLTNFKSPVGTSGANGTLELFQQIVDDSNCDFELRCLAARGIGEMDLTSAQSFDFVALSTSLTTLARDFCVDEMEYIDVEMLRDQVRSGASTTGMGGAASGGMSTAGGGAGIAGGFGGGMGQQSQKSLETIVARIQYGFDCIQCAINGVDGGSGVLAKLDENDAKAKEMKETLTKVLDEFKSTNDFIVEGPKNAGATGAAGAGYGATSYAQAGAGKKGSKKGATINVDSSSMKDHLLEKKIAFNELLGVDSF